MRRSTFAPRLHRATTTLRDRNLRERVGWRLHARDERADTTVRREQDDEAGTMFDTAITAGSVRDESSVPGPGLGGYSRFSRSTCLM